MENLRGQLGLTSGFSDVRDEDVVDEDAIECYGISQCLKPCCNLSRQRYGLLGLE